MVFPWLAAASLASTGAGLLSANAQQQSNAANLSLQSAIAANQLELADRAQRIGLATRVDANGNQVVYDPATNTVVTVLSPEQQQLADAAQGAQLSRLTVDEPIRRQAIISGAERSGREGQLADAILAQFQDHTVNGGVSPAALTSSMNLDRRAQINAGFDDVGDSILRQLVRGGTPESLQTAFRDLGRERTRQLGAVTGMPGVEGLKLAEAINQSRGNNMLQQYGPLAQRASGFTDTPIGRSPSDNLANASFAQAGSGASGLKDAILATAQAGNNYAQGMTGYSKPDYSLANALFSFGSIGEGLSKRNATDRLRKSTPSVAF